MIVVTDSFRSAFRLVLASDDDGVHIADHDTKARTEDPN